MVKIHIDDSELRAMIQKLSNVSREMRTQVAKAINNGLKETKPFAEGLVSQTYNVPTPNLGIKYAGAGNMEGYLKASGGMKPVTEFQPMAVGKSVSVEIIRGQRKSIVPGSRGPESISGAFLLPDGRVMGRRQAERYPIFPVSTIGIPNMLGSKKVSNPARDRMAELIRDRIAQLWLANF